MNACDQIRTEAEEAWRASHWFSMPTHADPILWRAAVDEVAALVGERAPYRIEPPHMRVE